MESSQSTSSGHERRKMAANGRGQVSLTPCERQDLTELDSRLFGFLRLEADEHGAAKKSLLLKDNKDETQTVFVSQTVGKMSDTAGLYVLMWGQGYHWKVLMAVNNGSDSTELFTL